MPLLVDNANIENEIEDSLTRKFPLEWTLEQQIRKFFRQIARDEALNLRIFGAPVSMDRYFSGFQEILYNHYIKVMNTSSSDFLNDFEAMFLISDVALQDYEEEKNQRITLFALTNSMNAATAITQTNKKDFEKVVTEVATLDAVADANGVDFNLPNEFENAYFDEVEGRIALIAATETHKAFEGGKFIAASALSSATALQIRKTWITTLDGKQRPEHNAVHMQERGLLEPFNVGGELLDVPGDPSASIWNIANCGCICVYSIDGREVSRTQAVRPR